MNQRKRNQTINHAIHVLMVYLVSGILIMYGGVNVSLNIISMTKGFYSGQWWAALPFILIFGLLPVVAGVLLLMMHPATRSTNLQKNSSKEKTSG